jgi:parvulin-like peptidyl-prolyl isomerase
VTRPLWLLAAGAGAGLALAIAGLVSAPETQRVPDGAIAAVNGSLVRRADYERALEALAADRRDALDEGDERHVLDRLVDEELLVQRAFELGLARQDRRVRAELVTAVIEAVTSEAAQREPGVDEVAAFFAEHRALFAVPGRARVEQVFVRAADDGDAAALARARDATARLRAGESSAAVQERADPGVVGALPAAALPAAKLRELLGPTAADALAALAPGGVTEPVRASGGYHVLRLVAREAPVAAELAEVEPAVRAEVQRRAVDAALRTYLDDLRRRAEIDVAGSAPP